MMRRILVLLIVTVCLGSTSVEASRLEDALEHRLRGAWAISRVEMRSDCSGIYNNNEVHAGGVSARASRFFEDGELVHIQKINLKSSRIDLYLKLAEPVLLSRHDGPFELFDENSCKVQLIIPLSRNIIRNKDQDAILKEVQKAVDLFSNRQEAVDDPGWNRRVRAEYPPDYEETLYEHSLWKVEETNAAIAARSADANHEALRIMDRIRNNRAYLAGFAAGVESMRRWDEDDCSDLLSVGFSSVSCKADQSGREYEDGFEDGQKLSFNLLLEEALQTCYLPPPRRP